MGERIELTGWQLCRTAPGECAGPTQLEQTPHAWYPTAVPMTVAASLQAAGAWSLADPARNFDADDWWFRCTFDKPAAVGSARSAGPIHLGLDGLATMAEVWLNGQPLVASDNMFIAHRCDVTAAVAETNELIICCRSLDAHLKARRPRPRWRVPMLLNQQLRWARTTLLGRTPGWSPPAAVVGPWRGVWLQQPDRDVHDVELTARLDGTDGVLELRCSFAGTDDPKLQVVVRRADQEQSAPLRREAGGHCRATVRVKSPTLWWPHTHGEPALYEVVVHGAGAVALHGAGALHKVVGRVGFRRLSLDRTADRFQLCVNGEAVFCRGACWMPLDAVTLGASADAYVRAVTQVRAGGMNMLRVSGTTIYEANAFYEACDALGVLVWQDFMFANMDYPEHDATFTESVDTEVRQFLRRVRHHCSVAILCGNSEVEQQAAMWGAPRELWSPGLFHERLAAHAASLCPDVPYWPSSAHGGAFPHDGSRGTTSYFGVGAYLRPLEDARRSAPRFASECLAFANVPEPSAIVRLSDGGPLPVHHPAWKARTPRDRSAGWDFEDVRDHYFEQLLGIKPLAVRYSDPERYLALSRVVTAEVMAAAFAEWRAADSGCAGALVWFLRDLWDGAGWGLIDAAGEPKSPYYYLRRLWQPQAVWVTDEGTNGLVLHVANEGQLSFKGTLRVSAYRHGEQSVATAERRCELAARGHIRLNVGELFDEFIDLSHAYRFGAQAIDLVQVQLYASEGIRVAEFCHLPLGLGALGRHDLGLTARAERQEDGVELVLQTRRYAHAVTVDAPGFTSEDRYFPLAPGAERQIRLRPIDPGPAPFRCRIGALNAIAEVTLSLPS